MTFLPAGYEQSVGYAARVDRVVIDALFAGPGVDYGLLVTPNGGMTVLVATGRAVVRRSVELDQGSYIAYNDSSNAVITIAPADPTQIRIDIIVVRVYDTALGDIKDGAYPEVVAGVVGSGSAPAVPNNSVLLSTVIVNAGVTSITAPNVFDSRTFAGANGSPGDIMWMSQDRAPSGWLLCRGQAVSRAAYPDLNSAYARTSPPYPHGSGDGSTTFNVPSFDNRMALGASGTRGFGTSGGEETHLLTSLESGTPVHTHTITDPGHSHTPSTPGTAYQPNAGQIFVGNSNSDVANPSYTSVRSWAILAWNLILSVVLSSDATGISAASAPASPATNAHNNMPPYVALWAMVKT